MTQIKVETKKGRDGWQCESNVNVNGVDWKISTWKSGKKLSCSAQSGKATNERGYSVWSFVMFSDPSVNLHSEIRRNSESAIKEVHLKGLERFAALQTANELPVKEEA